MVCGIGNAKKTEDREEAYESKQSVKRKGYKHLSTIMKNKPCSERGRSHMNENNITVARETTKEK